MPETNLDQVTLDQPPEPADSIDPTPEQPPDLVEPIDCMIADLRKWLDDIETKLAQAAEEARIPDVIPRFVTRYQP